jgi:uncharacterized protein YdhG (YjbR/CyaY superfamily)
MTRCLTPSASETKLSHVQEKPTTVEQYLETLNTDIRLVVENIRGIIHANIDGLEDCISYAIPAAKLNGKLVLHYSGWAHHVSLYPVPPSTPALDKKLAPYISGKSTLKFPVGKGHEVPYDLIAEISLAHLARLTAATPTPPEE